MMNLNSTNEELEALKYFLGDGNKVMNQLLISNAETDIALLNDASEDEMQNISYDREKLISNLMKIKALYTLILKQYYKSEKRTNSFFRATNLAEVERVKNEPYIDKFISAVKNLEIAENNFAQNWSRPTCINIKLENNIPYLSIKDVLENDVDEVIIAPFTRIKKYESSEDKQVENKNVKVYNIELEKQELEQLEDRDRYGLYNYILDNAYLVQRKLENCIKLDKENEVNYENIRKLEQLLIKYENSMDEKKDDDEIQNEVQYEDIERINKELEELKETTTDIFEKRRDNINFVNNWKKNIAVYMIAECSEIEKKFEGLEPPELVEEPIQTENNESDENTEADVNELENEVESDTISDEDQVKENIEEIKLTEESLTNNENEENNEATDEINEETNVDENKENESSKNKENESSKNEESEDEEDDDNDNPTFKRVKNESKENIKSIEELIENIKLLITKQQNHARIAGNIGSNYSALNNTFEAKSIAENLLEILHQVHNKIVDAGKENDEEKLEKISKINIEISTLINYLNNPKIALKNTKVTRFEEMAIIEENELKKGIAEKIREIRGEAELKKLKDDLEIIEEKNGISRLIGFFTGQNKLDEFMIEQIEVRQRTIRKNLSKKLNLAYNYSIHELMAEIEMFIDDNEDDLLVENDVENLKTLADELRRNYIISDSKVHSIAQKKSGRMLPADTRKLSKYEIIEIETYRFLNKYGYDVELKNDEPKYQDTMASEISRIIDYINSSDIL